MTKREREREREREVWKHDTSPSVHVFVCLFVCISMHMFRSINYRTTSSGMLLSVARIGAILGTQIFGLFIHAHPTIPILVTASCFVVGAICCIPLPATTQNTLLE